MPEDPMIDVDLDREIRRALALEPSPGFSDRVRSRLAEEPRPGFSRVGLLAAAACVTAAALYSWAITRPQPVQQTTTRVADIPLAPVQSPSEPPRIRPSSTKRGPATIDPIRRAVTPEVLIGAAEVEGFRRLTLSVRDGRFQGVPAPSDSLEVDLALPDIAIQPIAIEPIGE
jgi:hypothetical protein